MWKDSPLVLLDLSFWTRLNWRLCQPSSDTIWESSSPSYIRGLEVRGLSASLWFFLLLTSPSVEELHIIHPLQIFCVDFFSSDRKLTVLFHTSLLLHMLLSVLGMPFSTRLSGQWLHTFQSHFKHPTGASLNPGIDYLSPLLCYYYNFVYHCWCSYSFIQCLLNIYHRLD